MTDLASIIAGLVTIGENASAPEIIKITTADLDDSGLPASVPILWNRKTQAPVSLAASLNQHRLHPIRRRGTAPTTTIESFVALVNRQKTEESAIFADILNWRSPNLTAVINYNPRRQTVDGATVDSPIDADWGDHRISYVFPLSEEWKSWIGMNGEAMSQTMFAEFMEGNIPHLAAAAPDEAAFLEEALMVKVASPSTVLMLARGLQVNVSSVVKENRVLQSGEGEVTFHEEHRDAGGQKLVVPGAFMLQIPLFYMGEPVRVPVRLRYRVSGGKITWSYHLYRPEVVIGERLREDSDRAGAETGLPVYDGKPEVQADRQSAD